MRRLAIARFRLGPESLWKFSIFLHMRGLTLFARIVKSMNFLVFHSILPYQARVGCNLTLKHYALGCVFHPNVTIGDDVVIHHHVTLAAETWVGAPYRIVIEDGVLIGAGAVVLGRGDKTLTIGRGAKVGANAVVTNDVDAGAVVAGVPAKGFVKTAASLG